jgi:glycosyltransferase involved in cell wall biosynthesis
MLINVFAKNLGWLFEDLKRGFARVDIPGVEMIVGDVPCDDADAWVAIRTAEAASAPDPRRTVACMHDLYDDPALYTPDGVRGGVHGARGLVLCHPGQRRLLSEAGVSFMEKKVLERPLGPLSIFTPRRSRPEKFCIGWVGRNDRRKRLEWVRAIASRLELDRAAVRFMLVGWGLGDAAKELEEDGFECELLDREHYPIEAYPALYARMDALLITSLTEAGPLTLFEALATGVPVVSTPVGWSPHFAREAPGYVMLGADPDSMARHLRDLAPRRQELFDERESIARLVAHWRLDDWFGEVVDLAVRLASDSTQS